jgi:hypothetical protein
VNVLKEVRGELDSLREDLVKKANEIPTPQYLDAKRFMQELYNATIALERGEGKVQAQFQRFVEGGKSMQEIADYMVSNGLNFAPATAADESAYRAVHSALANHNIALNTQLGIDNRD